MPRIILLLLMVALFTACKNNTNQDDTKPGNEKAQTEPCYPFPQYLRDQVAYVDSMPLAVERIVTLNGKRIDSAYMEKPAFRQAVAPLFASDPNSANLRPFYTETSFQDLSLESLTFSIVCSDPTFELQQADILLNPETKKVKHLILKRALNQGDSTIEQNILWVNNMKCQVAEIITKKDGTSYGRTTEYIWDRPLK